jgi:iron complex transport system ATP-binding protein
MGRYPYLSRWGGYSLQDMNEALDAMEQTETVHLAQRMITEVSGGEAQRVIISRALAQKTEILLLDEATSSLDVAKKIQVFDRLKRKNSRGTTLLCAMHDLNLAALYCTRLIFLKEGKIVLDGPTQETFNEKKLSEIYETDVKVSRHPVNASPQAHFVPGQNDHPDRPEHGSPGEGNSAGLGNWDC